LIEIAATSLLITGLLYLAVNTDHDQRRLKTLIINGQHQREWRIAAPASWANRRVGLLNTLVMPENFGLLIASKSVHMKGMLCSIDLIGIDQNGKVKQIVESAAPNTAVIKMPHSTKQILELSTGSVRKLSVKINDTVTFGDLA
jgi:uncharacterized membrane protein (UPF0127 family)